MVLAPAPTVPEGLVERLAQGPPLCRTDLVQAVATRLRAGERPDADAVAAAFVVEQLRAW